jgi:hypothetical protein
VNRRIFGIGLIAIPTVQTTFNNKTIQKLRYGVVWHSWRYDFWTYFFMTSLHTHRLKCSSALEPYFDSLPLDSTWQARIQNEGLVVEGPLNGPQDRQISRFFFPLWGYLKSKVYYNRSYSVDKLKTATGEGYANITQCMWRQKVSTAVSLFCFKANNSNIYKHCQRYDSKILDRTVFLCLYPATIWDSVTV